MSGDDEDNWFLAMLRRRKKQLALLLGSSAIAFFIALRRQAANAVQVKVEMYSDFLRHLDLGVLSYVTFAGDQLGYTLTSDTVGKVIRETVAVPGDRASLLRMLAEKKIRFGTQGPSKASVLMRTMLLMLPLVYLVGLAIVISRMNSTSGVERKYKKNSNSAVTFKHVAGIDGAKREIQEIVDIFKNPARYRQLGARMPRGILLHGPPGTGKTLLSRALASEAGVTYVYACASDFVETLVGRGAARVRALWAKARREAPAIIFIDELDAIGKKRNRINGSEERDQTLAALLSEMDGFESRDDGSNAVVVLAATNCVDVLDPALVRPGRFDRQIKVGLPDANGRAEILHCHCQKIRTNADLQAVANEAEDMSGAMLANLVNEAALLAVRGGATIVQACHFDAALSRAKEALANANQSSNDNQSTAAAFQNLFKMGRDVTIG